MFSAFKKAYGPKMAVLLLRHVASVPTLALYQEGCFFENYSIGRDGEALE